MPPNISLPGMLYGKVLWSPCRACPHPASGHGRRQALEGVSAVVTAAMFPTRTTMMTTPTNDLLHGEKKKPFLPGKPVAAVAAPSRIAEEALRLIKVDYEELPYVTDVLRR